MLIHDSVNNEKIKLKFKTFQDSYLRNHKIDCKLGGSCGLCKNYSSDINKNIKLFYSNLKESQGRLLTVEFQSQQKPMIFTKEMIKLFYYKIKRKTFKFYRSYFQLIEKYKKANMGDYVRNIRMIVQVWLKRDNESHMELINHLLDVHSLEKELKTLLKNLKAYFTKHITVKDPESAVYLSDELNMVNRKLRRLQRKNKLISTEYTEINENINIMNGVLTYSLIIIRYTLESLINHSLANLVPLNIDNLEEFITLHFASDSMLICHIDLLSLYNQDIHIIKCTGDLIKMDKHNPTFLSTLFPKEIQNDCIKSFNYQVNLKNNQSNNNPNIISFPLMKEGFLANIKYSFYLTKVPRCSLLYIFGQFTETKHKLLLLDFNHPKITILGYCNDFLRMIHFKKTWMQYIKELKIVFYLNTVFYVITKNINEEGQEVLECELKYSFLIENMEKVYNQMNICKSFKSDTKNEILMKKYLMKLSHLTQDTYKVRLEKVTQYSEGIAMYNMKMSHLLKTSIIMKKKHVIEDIPMDFMDHDKYFDIHSTTSVSTEKSIDSLFNTRVIHSEYQILNQDLNKQISKEANKLSLFTIIMLSLNIFLIIICIIFFYLQLTQLKKLSSLSILYSQFKNIQYSTVNILLSLISTVCFSSTPSNNYIATCNNPYDEYTKYFHEKYGLPIEYNLLLYVKTELRFKAEFGLNNLVQFKNLLHNTSNIQFQEILDQKMKYYTIDEGQGLSKFITTSITVDESLKNLFNSLLIITKDKTYVSIPIYFLCFDKDINGESQGIKLSPIQKEIYKTLINYINFFYSFSLSDNKIKQSFDKSSYNMKSTLIYFMVITAILNLCLWLLCRRNINTAYFIFKVLINNIIIYSDSKHKSFQLLKDKIKSLIQMAKLYKRNPNKIIKKMCEKRLENYHSSKFHHQIFLTTLDMTTNKKTSFHISFGDQFFNHVLGHLLLILKISFGIFFLIIIMFNVLLIIQYNSLLLSFQYLQLIDNFEQGLLEIVVLMTLSHAMNISNDDLGKELGKNNNTSSVINDLITNNMIIYTQINYLSEYHDLVILQDHINDFYTCDQLFLSFFEYLFNTTSTTLGLDYRIANSYICKAFDLLNVPNLFYLKTTIDTKTLQLNNKRQGKDYDSLYAFASDYELYDLYTMILFILRPLSKGFKENYLMPQLRYSFTMFDIFMGMYLIVNICLEISIFAIVRRVISRKITRIQKNLNLLNNCVMVI